MSEDILDLEEHCVRLLEERGVSLDDIADCARYLQADYHVDLTKEELLESVHAVLSKREVQYAVMTGIALDKAAEEGKLDDPYLIQLMMSDAPLFGTDEVVAYGICNTYGSIALTNFGFIDKKKYGIIRKLNRHGKNTDHCNTFIDDIVGAIAASAASRFAHRWTRDVEEEE